MSDKPPIGPVLTHYGATLPPHGGKRSMRCPFHDDSRASAIVNFDENNFHCFTCDMSGDAYNLIMEKEGVGFREAVELAESVTGTRDSRLSESRPGRPAIPVASRNRTRYSGYVPPRLRGNT